MPTEVFMHWRNAALALLVVGLGTGCAKDARTALPTAVSAPPKGPPAGSAAATASAATPTETAVYFDFDSTTLDETDAAVVQRWAAFLASRIGPRLTLTGHCDERGTREYNVTLGLRRARAVSDLLIGYGVGAGRITVLSAGEEKPAVEGHGEEAWRRNRRVEFSPS
jgi:peptidoglycan-associated lipoprotein